MKKVLFVATYGGFFSSCEMSNMKILREMGYEIHGAANFELIEHNERPKILEEFGLIQHHIPFIRSPFNLNHIKMYKSLSKLMKEEKFDVIDTHNPIVSVLSRIAAKKNNITPVIYTAHGFFFYKGGPLIYKLIFKPIEHYLARYTDALITINKEDYFATKKMNIRGKAFYINGVGFNYEKILNQDIILDLRKELGIKDGLILVSVGELNKNKNHEIVIRALSEMFKENPEIKITYCICGRGKLLEHLQKLIEKLDMQNYVKLLGFRLDVNQINANADMFILPSYREGLPVSIMEAMACRLPILAADNRGTRDLVVNEKGGFLFNPNSIDEIKKLILKLYKDNDLRKSMGEFNYERAKLYSSSIVISEMKLLYNEVCKNGK